jgi:hypothetical protein
VVTKRTPDGWHAARVASPRRRVRIRPLGPLAILVGVLAAPGTALATDWSSPADVVEEWRTTDASIVDRFFAPGFRYAIPARGIIGGNAIVYGSNDELIAGAPGLPVGTTVMYDAEPWARTPFEEQTHPRRAMRRFVAIAHAHGLRAVLAPSRSLATPDPRCIRAAFLDCGYLEIPADAFQLQAQRLECDLDRFGRFVRRAKARSASPLIIELTTVWGHECVSPQVVHDAWLDARPWADGYALWARSGDLEGLEALRLIAQTSTETPGP